MTDYRSLPKTELHLHIEGAAKPEFVRQVAARRNADISHLFDAKGDYQWADFTQFLRAYDDVAAFFKTPEANAELAEEVLRESAANGVIYTEIFISPFHTGADEVAWAEYIAAISEGAAKAKAAYGIEARFIPLAERHLGPDAGRRAAELAAKHADDPMLVGFGMAGDERVYAPKDFAPAFDLAREAGFKLTAHAGEFGGADSVRDAWRDLKLDRIDHGVRAIEDAALVAELAEAGVCLTTCPGSNIELGVFADWKEHSIEALRAAGCNVTVSTDDPPFFHTNMTREYEMLAASFGYDKAALLEFSRNGAHSAFCDDATRANILAKIDASA